MVSYGTQLSTNTVTLLLNQTLIYFAVPLPIHTVQSQSALGVTPTWSWQDACHHQNSFPSNVSYLLFPSRAWTLIHSLLWNRSCFGSGLVKSITYPRQ